MNESRDGYECEFDAYDGKAFSAVAGPAPISDSKIAGTNEVSELSAVLTSTEESVASTIATVATTLEQLKSKDSDDAQASYEAVSATQDANFTAAVGEGPLNPSPDDTSLSSILASLTAWHGMPTTWLRMPSIRAIPAVRM